MFLPANNTIAGRRPPAKNSFFFQNALNRFLDIVIQNADPNDQIPLAESVRQKFSLFTMLTVHVIHGVRPEICIDGIPINLIQIIEIVKPLSKGSNAMAIGKDKFTPGLDNGFNR
ncbi:MAG: hypothetical protein U9P10_07925 [Thermodesulfobacteriota bacterium]|nr:hypothetical protein [Thermodesulfobacteriota bacterium]